MVDFKWYLGRQGVRGQKGEKGDKGFSPLITEKTNTREEYVLHIQNETDDTSFDTPNLKEGLVPEDMGGTYVRLNRETGKEYYGDIDEATEITKGAVKLEPDETVLTPTSETSVITAEQAVQNYTKKTETQDLQNIVTANSGDIDKLHANLDKLGNEVTDLSGRVTANEADIATMKTSLSMKQTKLTAGSNIILTDLTDGTVRIDSTGGGGTGDIPIATTTTAGKVKPDGNTITITDDGTISAVGGGGSTPANMVTTDTEQEISGQKNFTYLGSSFDGNIYPSLKIKQLTIGETGEIASLSAFQASNGLAFYISSSNKRLTMNADDTQNRFSLGTNADKLNLISDGKVTLIAGNQGTLTIDNGLKFTDYYQKEYDLLNVTPTVIDGGNSTTV